MALALAHPLSNMVLASCLREYGELLEQQGADSFRIAAYRNAADVIGGLGRPAAAILAAEGRAGLIALPAVGRAIASALAELLTTGRWSQLERLRGTIEPEKLLRSIPGIGPIFASRICEELHVESLEALEIAAHDGRLRKMKGFGPRRVQMVQAALAERLGRPRLWKLRQSTLRPGVDVLLDVDREYREKSEIGVLPKISPRRFNPAHVAWQPILHTRRGSWEFTALFSNTRRAHDLGRVRDWVVIYYQTDDTAEGQCTVVTETRGPMAGTRVVRGREDECATIIRLRDSSRVAAEPPATNPGLAQPNA